MECERECVSVAGFRCGDHPALAGMLAALAGTPLPDGAVACVGLRLDGFPDSAWRDVFDALVAGAVRSGPAELETARRFLRCEDGVRHLLGRALLRHVAERHCGAPCAERWPTNAWGKPEALAGMHFSISHSGGDVWLAFSRAGAVGVDVEHEAPARADIEPLLHAGERAADLDDPARRRNLWIRKEALVKATGMGLSLPLADFRVAACPSAGDWLIDAPASFPVPWSTHDVPAPGCAGVAVAVRARGIALSWRLGCLRWEGRAG